MGRPREHDEQTAAALLAAAERTVAASGLDALSVRGAAAEAGTTTRAVYSLFGSKEGLVSALGARGFEILGQAVRSLPVTPDARADLVAAGLAFRRFALDHPTLFAISVQRTGPSNDVFPHFRPAAVSAMATLHERLARLDAQGRLGGRSVAGAAVQFHALCEGLAAIELRSPEFLGEPERAWNEALTALVEGLATSA